MFYNLTISMPMLAMLFWLVFFLLQCLIPREDSRREHRKTLISQHRILAVFYGFAFVLYTGHWFYFSGMEDCYIRTAYFIANLSVYPLFWFYLRRLAGRPVKSEVWLLLPALLLPPCGLIASLTGWQRTEATTSLLIRICFALQVIYVILRGQHLIHHFRQELDNYYSDERSRQLRPLSALLWLFAITAVVSSLLNLVGREQVRSSNPTVIVCALAMTFLLWILGFIASRLDLDNAEETQETQEAQEAREPRNIQCSPGLPDTLSRRFSRLMEEKRPYTDPNLTLQDLATMLGTNRTYLSQLLHHEFQTNFSAYINSQRLVLAKEILSSPRYTSGKEAIQEAILHSGFSSESTFYRLFKQESGLSPLAWRQANLKTENQQH